MNDALPERGDSRAKPDAGLTALVHRNRAIEELCLRRIEELRGLGMDARWCASAKTHIELGFMALNRAVAMPERLQGELDFNVGGEP